MDDSPWGDVPSQSESGINTTNTDEPSTGGTLSPPPASQPSVTSPRSPSARGGRAGKKLVVVQPTRLEAVDGALDPLGPLGAEPTPEAALDQGPTPPRKETLASRPARPASSASQQTLSQSMMSSVDLNDEDSGRAKGPPPVQPPQPGIDSSKRTTQPSMSIEQAAKPSFDISVGDPHKVGDLTSSHIVYQVRTKTTSKAYRQPEFAVSRRYKDFLWLYTSLHNNNPGVVVPPPPEKQVVGRFDSNFVESRRAALERMLNKTAAHPILQHDADLKIFLESEAFNVDVKNKENREPDLGQNKGMFSSLGIGGSSGKFVEHDDWFHDRKIYLDALENQLRALMRSIDTVITQRKVLSEAAGEFSTSLHSLSRTELSPLLSGPLDSLSELQLRIRELYERQAQQDVLTLGITVDEYIRLIGSVKQAFNQRQKAFHSWHAAETELVKRKSNQDKLLRQGKTQQDKLNQLNADVSDAERRVHQARLLFEDMGRLMRNELEKFEREKVEDFKSGIETFLESAVEAQKELIELWETFLLQLDTEDDGQPFYKPPVEAASGTGEDSGTKPAENETTDTAAAAITTAEQEA